MFSDKRRGDIWWMVDTHRKPADQLGLRRLDAALQSALGL